MLERRAKDISWREWWLHPPISLSVGSLYCSLCRRVGGGVLYLAMAEFVDVMGRSRSWPCLKLNNNAWLGRLFEEDGARYVV